MKTLILTASAAIISISSVQAVVVVTEFNTSDGFTTGLIGSSVTVNQFVTFSGGQQEQMFLGAAYNNGPAGYIFINGASGFNGAPSTGDNTGLISFGGLGASTVSFHAANLANGAATIFNSFDVNGNALSSLSTQVSTLSGTNTNEILTFSAVGNVNIGSIQVDLPGPAANPPYAAAIDTFSATIVVPEPSSTLLLGLAFGASLLRRRR